jgi:hypothetical protein
MNDASLLTMCFRAEAAGALSALAAGLLLLSSAAAAAAPKRLDCSLTKLETRAGGNFDVKAESRSITVVFDDAAKTLTVYQDDSGRALNQVTMTQISMNGYVDEMSLGIDLSSWSIVLQTYKPNSITSEFGACSQSAKPPP